MANKIDNDKNNIYNNSTLKIVSAAVSGRYNNIMRDNATLLKEYFPVLFDIKYQMLIVALPKIIFITDK